MLGWDRVFSYSAVVVPGTEPRTGLLAIQDITDRKRAEEALHESNERLIEADRRKDEFLGVLSHELRNPLAPIRNGLFILRHADAAGEQARRARLVMERQVSHLTRLIDDLLDVTRIARGKIQLHRADVDIGEIVTRTAEDHRALIEQDRIALEVHTSQVRMVVNADEARITQIVGNLLQNARKFTREGGRITLSVAPEGDCVAIRVRDTGVGIDPELLPRLFEPFTQAKQSLARTEGGLGLGLALVKTLTVLHGGNVQARSTGPGRGSEFAVILPLAARSVTSTQKMSEPEVARRRYVLIVEDNRDAADSLAELVRLFGHDVDVAYDGPSAIEKVSANKPEVVLCDIGLPGMSGYEVARALRAALDGDVRLVAVSGYAQPADVERAVAAGFDAHVAKPPDPARLERLLA